MFVFVDFKYNINNLELLHGPKDEVLSAASATSPQRSVRLRSAGCLTGMDDLYILKEILGYICNILINLMNWKAVLGENMLSIESHFAKFLNYSIN